MGSSYELQEREGRKVRIYPSGVIIDHESGRLIRGADRNIITVENSSALHRRKQEKKRAAVLQAANDAVTREDFRTVFRDMAFVAAIAETAMKKATNPSDPKAIEAARFLLSESGLTDMQEDPDAAGPGSVPPRVLLILAELHQRRENADTVVDGSIRD